MEDEEGSDSITIGLDDSDVEEIDKVEVKSALKELAELKCKEAKCISCLAEAVPNMRESEVVIVTDKNTGTGTPQMCL